MKKLSIVAAATMLFFASPSFANDSDGDKKGAKNVAKEIRTQIVNYLGELDLSSVEGEMFGNVRLTINKDHEIVVLSVDTKSEFLESYIKGKLNYQKVEADEIPRGRIYTMPVRIQ
ncbi:MAG: hypothetical protein AB3N16_02365 [Flavobacteriaceae bacterium]